MEWREEARRIDLVMATFLVGSIVLGVGGSDNWFVGVWVGSVVGATEEGCLDDWLDGDKVGDAEVGDKVGSAEVGDKFGNMT